jgi:hypothetical protein
MRKLGINYSRRESVRSLIVCIGFVAVGVWLALRGNRFGWVAALFFGSGIPLFIWQLAGSRRRPVADRGVAGRALRGEALASKERVQFRVDVDEADPATTEAARRKEAFRK